MSGSKSTMEWQTGVAVGLGLAAGFSIGHQLQNSPSVVRILGPAVLAGLVAWGIAVLLGRVKTE